MTNIYIFNSSFMLNSLRQLEPRLVSITNFNAQFIYSIIIIYITLQSLTCFEQYHAHLLEVKLYCYSIWYRHSP